MQLEHTALTSPWINRLYFFRVLFDKTMVVSRQVKGMHLRDSKTWLKTTVNIAL